ncbi:hypothetical protein ACFXTO_029995 [Malus domestica]
MADSQVMFSLMGSMPALYASVGSSVAPHGGTSKNGLLSFEAQNNSNPPASTGVSNIDGTDPLSPPTENHKELDLDPSNLGPQLSLLNLIACQEQSDNLSKIGTAFTASTKRDSG